ncbi:hypothetical protein [Nonomuraea jabiensis]|nr:hypothetical protein [Nonomuraea jabiensis]
MAFNGPERPTVLPVNHRLHDRSRRRSCQ